MRAHKGLLGGLGAAFVLGAMAAAAPGIAFANPSCGATLKHSVKLTSDMDCSAFTTDGLDVGKAGITINLNGHTLSGPATSCICRGIVNGNDGGDTRGFNNVTIENGTVAGYPVDVMINRTSGNHVSHIRAFVATYNAIEVFNSRNGSIDHSKATGPASWDAIKFSRDKNFNLLNSKVFGTVGTVGFGDSYSKATVQNVTANGMQYGFIVESPLTGYKLVDDTANNNAQYGFWIEENEPTFLFQATLIGNTADNNVKYGFIADHGVSGKQNHASGNGTNCLRVPCGP